MDDNIHNLRDALLWLGRRISEEAELDGEMTNAHAIQLGFITNMLEKFPLRQCDVGTPEEQISRFMNWCLFHQRELKVGEDNVPYEVCLNCPIQSAHDEKNGDIVCGLEWSQMPYEAERKGEGDGK